MEDSFAGSMVTNVIAVSGTGGGQYVGWTADSVRLPKWCVAMERIEIPVLPADGGAGPTVTARVLKVIEGGEPIRHMGGIEWADTALIVAVDVPLGESSGWASQDWASVGSGVLAELDALSRCVEATSVWPPYGPPSIEVTVHDLASMVPESLSLLPRGVRDGLERTLLAMPDD